MRSRSKAHLKIKQTATVCCEACGRLNAALCRKFQASHWHASTRVNRRQRYGEPLKHLPVRRVLQPSGRAPWLQRQVGRRERVRNKSNALPFFRLSRSWKQRRRLYRCQYSKYNLKSNYLIMHRINLGGFHWKILDGLRVFFFFLKAAISASP